MPSGAARILPFAGACMPAFIRICTLCLFWGLSVAISFAASGKDASPVKDSLPAEASAVPPTMPPFAEVPYELLGRYAYTEPNCNGVLELLPAARGYRAALNTTCADLEICSEAFFLEAMPGPEAGSLILRDAPKGLELYLNGNHIRVPEGTDHLCLYDQGRMSGTYAKYTPPPLLLTERSEQLEKTLERMRALLAEASGGEVRESAVGKAFPLGVQDVELSGLLMEAYLSNPSSRVPAASSREQMIAALIAYHQKVLNGMGFSLEMTAINAFAMRDFGYWGFLKTSRRADVVAPYLAILDSPEVLKPLLEHGVISRQATQSLIDFAPWYRTAFP